MTNERIGRRLLGWWHKTPLYLRILGAVVLGLLTGLVLGVRAGPLRIPSDMVLRLLGALAPPLILLAIIHSLLHVHLPGRTGLRLVRLLLTNTVVAISIGLLVANVIQPGRWTHAAPQEEVKHKTGGPDPLALFLDNVPKSLLGPFTDTGNVIGVILIAVALGIALRRVKHDPVHTVGDVVEITLRTLIVILHWIIDVVPLAVFGIVASIVGVNGFSQLVSLGAFVIAVIVALALQATYYLVRIRFGSWVRPIDALRGTRDALVMAFSTGSSTATMPVTFACLREKVGLREESASLGSLVGANFNNDGTALYEAMAALFVSQMLVAQGVPPLGFGQQLMIVLTSIVASVGAAGIPEAGLVTMTLVFKAVDLPVEYIPLLLTVDWFLDRCRTAINVMGDINVSCLLDGKKRDAMSVPPEVAIAAESSTVPQSTTS